MRYLFIFLLLIAGCETLVEPEPAITPAHRANADISNLVEMRYYTNDLGWSNWGAATDSIPEDQVLVLQFKYGDSISSVVGFSYPVLDSCFQLPYHDRGNTNWRITHGTAEQLWPASGRIELRYYETHVTQTSYRTLLVMAELWDDDSQSYLTASPWYNFRFTNLINERNVHQE